MPNTIAFIAHDRHKEDLITLIKQYQETLSRYQAIATANTGKKIQQQTNLQVNCLLSGSTGGDVQIAAKVAEGEIAAVLPSHDKLADSKPATNSVVCRSVFATLVKFC